MRIVYQRSCRCFILLYRQSTHHRLGINSLPVPSVKYRQTGDNKMKIMWQCMFTPRLYKIYRDGSHETLYEPHILERWADRIISSANVVLNIGIYMSPFICMYMYRRSMTLEEVQSVARLLGGIGSLLLICFVMRGVGRVMNTKYTTFLADLTSPVVQVNTNTYLETLRKYDFDFAKWPVTYTVPPSKDKASSWKTPFRNSANIHLPAYQRITIQALAFIATHTFGLSLIYPGKLGFVNGLLWTPLMQGRTQLVEQYNGKRTKIQTADGNQLDTMFVDQRNRAAKGKTLVICSEGNGGFYEIGIMMTPIKAGYSALGWNHPGFAGSVGTPFPEQEQAAIDAVMRFAMDELGFNPEDIVLFGWSIGGYTAAWAANQYPVKGLILDATFDDLLALAENQMPRSWSLLVKEVIRSYVDLNIAELVANYSGPIQLIRRTEDEIISLRPGVISTNRGNHLLAKLIASRHPDVMGDQDDDTLDKFIALQDVQRATLERSDITPEERNKLRLIKKYMCEYKSSHCTPLPERIFDSLITNLTIDALQS